MSVFLGRGATWLDGDVLPVSLWVSVTRRMGVQKAHTVLITREGCPERSHANSPTVCKILGAGSEANMGFQELVDLGRSTSSNTGSICAALDHCHVPGRSGDWQIPAGRVEIGLGLHNETVSLTSSSANQ